MTPRAATRALALAVLTAALPMIVAASGAACSRIPGAGTPGDPAEACSSRAWFAAPDDTRVGNLAGVARALEVDDPAMLGWRPEPPTASSTAGAGTLQVAHAAGASVEAPGVATARFEGTVSGNLDVIALDLYMVTSHEYQTYLPGGGPRSSDCAAMLGCGGTYPVELWVEVDGNRHDLGVVQCYLYPPSTSGNLAAMRFRVAVTGLFDGVDDPAAVHRVAVELLPHEDEVTLLLDATEWPSKILFNPADTTSYATVAVDDAGDHGHG